MGKFILEGKMDFETVFKGLKIEIYLVKIFLRLINNLENYLLVDGCL